MIHRLVACAAGVTLLAGCSSSSGTIGPFRMRPTSGTTAGGNNMENGDDTAPSARPQQSSPHTGAAAGDSGPKWVISMPDSAVGDQKLPEDNAAVQKFETAFKTDMDALGVAGQRVHAVYDESKYYYLVVWGINGEGFNPANLQNIYPKFPTDGLPSGSTVEYPKVDPGPHGGDDQCTEISFVQSSDTAMGPITIESNSTSCMWMTTTTIGYINFIAKDPSDLSTPLQMTPAVVGPAMLKVRDAVEHRQG